MDLGVATTVARLLCAISKKDGSPTKRTRENTNARDRRPATRPHPVAPPAADKGEFHGPIFWNASWRYRGVLWDEFRESYRSNFWYHNFTLFWHTPSKMHYSTPPNASGVFFLSQIWVSYLTIFGFHIPRFRISLSTVFFELQLVIFEHPADRI